MSPIQGLTRFRKHQFGRQAAFATAIAAKRAYPFTGVPSVNLNWTDAEGDVGSLDLVAPPTRRAPEIGASLNHPTLDYNSLPLMLSALFGGGETPTGSGTSKTWAHVPASVTADAFDLFTYEFGDDVTSDWFQLRDGILSSLQISGDESLGPLSAAMSWVFGHAASTGSTDSPVDGTVPTTGLTVDAQAIPVYLKDCTLYIDTAPGDMGTTPIADAMHSFNLNITQEIDQKRFAPAPGFELSGYGRGARIIELGIQFAKTSDTVGTGSESDAWMSDTAVDRMVRLEFESTAVAETGSPDVPFSWVIDLPLRYYTREDGNIGGNSTVTLTGKAFLEAETLDQVFSSTVVNTLASAGL
jgi:hypothetical protein